MEQCLLLRRDFTYAVETVRVVTENLIKICGSGEIALSRRNRGSSPLGSANHFNKLVI